MDTQNDKTNETIIYLAAGKGYTFGNNGNILVTHNIENDLSVLIQSLCFYIYLQFVKAHKYVVIKITIFTRYYIQSLHHYIHKRYNLKHYNLKYQS